MDFRNKQFFLGLGLGIALVLSAMQIGFGYWRNLIQRNAAPQGTHHFSSTDAYTTLPSPLLPGYRPSPKEVQEYENWSLRSLDGKRLRISDLQGRPVFISLWATWCPPCVVEMPGIQKLAESLRGEPIGFLLISDEDEKRLKQYVESEPSLPVYRPTENKQMPALFAGAGRPATFILNRQGEVVFMHRGAANWNTDEVREYLRKLK